MLATDSNCGTNLIALHGSDRIEGLGEKGADPSSFGKQCFKFFLTIFSICKSLLGGLINNLI